MNYEIAKCQYVYISANSKGLPEAGISPLDELLFAMVKMRDMETLFLALLSCRLAKMFEKIISLK